MIHLKAQVHRALEGICPEVIYGYPRDYTGGEVISWRESENRRHAQADGREHLVELRYMIEIFAGCAERAAELMEAVDARMQEAGLRREAAVEQYEKDAALCHTSVRYRALADVAGNIYQ